MPAPDVHTALRDLVDSTSAGVVTPPVRDLVVAAADRRRRRVRSVTAMVVALAVVSGAALIATTRDETSQPPVGPAPSASPSVALPGPVETIRDVGTIARVTVPGRSGQPQPDPGVPAVGRDAVWTPSSSDSGHYQIEARDPITLAVLRTVGVANPVASMAVLGDDLWFTDIAGYLIRLDTRRGVLTERYLLGSTVENVDVLTLGPLWVHAGLGSLWLTQQVDSDASLRRVDPATGRVVATLRLDQLPGALMAFGPDSVWINAYESAAVFEVDPDTMTLRRKITLPGAYLDGLVAAGEHAVAAFTGPAYEQGSVVRIDRDGAVTTLVRNLTGVLRTGPDGTWLVGRDPTRIQAGTGDAGWVALLDPAGRVLRRGQIATDGNTMPPRLAGVGLGFVWAFDVARGQLVRLRPTPPDAAPVLCSRFDEVRTVRGSDATVESARTEATAALVDALPPELRDDAALFFYPHGGSVAGLDTSGTAAEAAGQALDQLYAERCG